MKTNNENALQEQRLKAALRLAEIKATDKEDMENCVSDMQKSASLEESQARIVAAAVRAKHLPNILRESGLDMLDGEPLEAIDLGTETAGFAKDNNDETHDDADAEFVENEDFDSLNSTEDFDDDMGEAIDDTNIATFQIEVPADMVEVAQQAVQKALDEALGGDTSADDVDEENADAAFDGLAEDDADDDLDDDKDTEVSDSVEEVEETTPQHTASKVNTMTKEAKEQRRAEREALLQRVVVAEEAAKPHDRGLGKDTTEGTYGGEKAKPFQHDSEAQYHGEKDYPTMSLKGGEGNSQRNENPTYANQPVPTMNPENLQLKGAVDAVKLDGTPDGTLEYEIKFDQLNDVPSADADRGPAFEIPTQMENLARKTTVASSDETEQRLAEVEDVVYNYLVEAGVEGDQIGKMTVAQGVHFLMKTASSKKEETKANDLTVEINAEDAKDERKAAVRESRIKTAYACAYQLATNGLLSSGEVDGYAETMLNDGLTADSMIRQTSLLMRSAKSNAERVATAAAEKFSNVRTASSPVVSSSPALTGGQAANSASLDIQQALRGVFTMPRVDED